MSKKNKLVCGVGINDADYIVQPLIEGKVVICPYYKKWVSMLSRCYSDKYQQKYPTYIDCIVCESWKTFSNFRKWMETQEWEGKDLDKDILFTGNKIYSPETCVFVHSRVNRFLLDRGRCRGDCLLGVSKKKSGFEAFCGDGKNYQEYLGTYRTSEEAHKAWKAYKHRLACKLVDEQSDQRVAEALRKRFALNSPVLFAPETDLEAV